MFKVSSKSDNTTGMTAEQIRQNNLIIVNDVITNLVFNLGNIYADFIGYLTLDGNNLNYWTYAGEYGGDFVMRFWHRDDLSETF